MSLKDKTKWKIVTTPKEGCGIMSRGVYYPKDIMTWIYQHIHHLESDHFKPIRIYYDDEFIVKFDIDTTYEYIKNTIKQIYSVIKEADKDEVNR